MSDFRIPPISTLIGSGAGNFFKVIGAGGRIERAYYLKLLLTTLIVFITTPFRIYEKLVFKNRIRIFRFEKQPLFILGHWRSGTTFLHNLLCEDADAGYVTTYQSVFPNNLASGFIFKQFMKRNMPDKRPTDNVKLGIDLPQEDEFALGNMNFNSFYNFFYFPKAYQRFYNHSVKDVNKGDVPSWDEQYKALIIKALLNTGGKRAVIKNPVNSARVKSILRIFPDAKFVFIYRNPVTVFLSTRKFFYALFPSLWFHRVDHAFIDEMIFENFRNIMNAYYDQKTLIPEANIMEIRFEDFEKDPLGHCQRIYSDLLEADFESAHTPFENYLAQQKSYVKNSYEISSVLLDKIYSEWGDYMNKWDYGVPDDLIVVPKQIP